MPHPHEQKLQEVVNSLTSESFSSFVAALTAERSTSPSSARPAPPHSVRPNSSLRLTDAPRTSSAPSGIRGRSSGRESGRTSMEITVPLGTAETSGKSPRLRSDRATSLPHSARARCFPEHVPLDEGGRAAPRLRYPCCSLRGSMQLESGVSGTVFPVRRAAISCSLALLLGGCLSEPAREPPATPAPREVSAERQGEEPRSKTANEAPDDSLESRKDGVAP